MALLKEGDVRSASIIADTDVSVAVMSTTDFKRICDMYSAFKLIIMQVVLKRVLENKATLIKAVELAEKRESQIN
jgi:CRP-like cAMP-binding protein